MSFWFTISPHVCKRFTCMYVCLALKELIRVHQIPWNWSYRGCKPLCGSWKQNPGPLLEQQVLLISEPLLQPLKFFLKIHRFSQYMPNLFSQPHQELIPYFPLRRICFSSLGVNVFHCLIIASLHLLLCLFRVLINSVFNFLELYFKLLLLTLWLPNLWNLFCT